MAAGATPLLGRRLQEDALLDTRGRTARGSACVLRVRMESGKSRLTFKGPVQPRPMKVREELETVVGDGEVLLRVFEELGLARLVPLREVPRGVLARGRDRRDRRDAGRRLRRDRGQRTRASRRWPPRSAARRTTTSLDSYRALFLQHRDALGLTGSDMVFDARTDGGVVALTRCRRGARADGGPRHAASAATYVRAKAGGAGQRRAARRAAIVAWLAGHGVSDIVAQPAPPAGRRSPRSSATAPISASRVRYSWEQPVLGSAGGPRHALPLLTDGGRRAPRSSSSTATR